MRTYSGDLSISESLPDETPQKNDRGLLILVFFILLVAEAAELSGSFYAKIPVGVFLILVTLPAVFAAAVNKVQIPGRKILLILLLLTLLNILNSLMYHTPIVWWFRMAFCTYIFVATVFFAAYKMNSLSRRYYTWILLIIFLSFNSLLDFTVVAKLGLAQVETERAVGTHAFTVVALLLIFPVFGSVLAKKKWLFALFGANLFLLFLSGSRGVFLVIGMATLYSFIFIQKRFTSRFIFLAAVLLVGAIIINTPIYHNFTNRLSLAMEHRDPSFGSRLDEMKSAITDVRGTWLTFLFGKGYGTPWKVHYTYVGGREPELPGGYNINTPHSDYVSRWLYCGLVGLIVQILLYIVVGLALWRAIKRARLNDVDVYTQVRLHGAMLVLLYMIMAGVAGGVFYTYNNNIFEAFVLGLALCDAQGLLSRKAIPQYQVES